MTDVDHWVNNKNKLYYAVKTKLLKNNPWFQVCKKAGLKLIVVKLK